MYRFFVTGLLLLCSGTMSYCMHLRYFFVPRMQMKQQIYFPSKALALCGKRELMTIAKEEGGVRLTDARVGIDPLIIEKPHDVIEARKLVECAKSQLEQQLRANRQALAQLAEAERKLMQDQSRLCVHYAALCRQGEQLNEKHRQLSAAVWFLGLEGDFI
jgi:hypothetical protein